MRHWYSHRAVLIGRANGVPKGWVDLVIVHMHNTLVEQYSHHGLLIGRSAKPAAAIVT
jgi:hypothetical protein